MKQNEKNTKPHLGTFSHQATTRTTRKLHETTIRSTIETLWKSLESPINNYETPFRKKTQINLKTLIIAHKSLAAAHCWEASEWLEAKKTKKRGGWLPRLGGAFSLADTCWPQNDQSLARLVSQRRSPSEENPRRTKELFGVFSGFSLYSCLFFGLSFWIGPTFNNIQEILIKFVKP